MQEAADEIDRSRVCPVEVVEGDNERTLCRKRLEQDVEAAEQAMPLIGLGIVRWRFAGWSQRWQDTRQELQLIALDLVESLCDRRRHVSFERLGEDGERQVALELGGSARQRPVAAILAP